MNDHTIHGSTLAFPFAADSRGGLATVSSREEIVRQSILSILSTRQGERVMLPDYGIPDFVFQTIDAGFPARVAYFLRRQILAYEPLVEAVSVTLEDADGAASVSLDSGRVALNVRFIVRGSNVPQNLVYPIWQFEG